MNQYHGYHAYYPLLPFLVEHGSVVIYDPRGTGQSDKHYETGFTLKQHVADLETIRKTLGYRKINIIGGSYGGIVAQGYAIKFQQRLNKLILAVTTHHHSFHGLALKNMRRLATKAEKPLAITLLAGKVKSNADVDKTFTGLLGLYSTAIRKKPSLKKKFPKYEPDAFSAVSLNKGFSGFLRRLNNRSHLPKLKIPTLIIAGKYDWICDVSLAYEMNQLIPNSELAVLPGGHCLSLDCPKAYQSTISSFLDS